MLSIEEEAIVVAFRRHTLLPLDDCLYALQASIPHLTRSSLHRCFQRHGISRLPEVEGDKPKRSKFRSHPIGYFHIDIAEVRTEQGKLYMFVAIDRTSKFAFVELHESAKTATSRDFLLRLIEAVPYKIHTVLTDNGIQFTTPGAGGSAVPLIREAIANGEQRIWAHAFEYACARNDIDHRTTKPKHPWTNGQVERMNRTIKDATVKRFYYETHDQLREHLANFVAAYNFAKRLKTLRGLTPYEYICKCWTKNPDDSPQIRTTKFRDQTSSANIVTRHRHSTKRPPPRAQSLGATRQTGKVGSGQRLLPSSTRSSRAVGSTNNEVDPKALVAEVLARIAGHPVSRIDELLPRNRRPHETDARAA